MHFLTILLALFAALVIYEVGDVMRHAAHAKMLAWRTEKISRPHDNPTHRVLILGDSWMCGTGAREKHNSLVGRLADDFERFHIDNAAENGLKVRGLYKKLMTLSERTYDLVIVEIGGNDLLRFTRPAQLERDLCAIIEKASSFSRYPIVLISPVNGHTIPAFRGFLRSLILAGSLRRRTKVFHDLYRKISKDQEIHLVELFCGDDEDELWQRRDELFAPDRIHPNDEGYGVVYKKIKACLDRILDGDLSGTNRPSQTAQQS